MISRRAITCALAGLAVSTALYAGSDDRFADTETLGPLPDASASVKEVPRARTATAGSPALPQSMSLEQIESRLQSDMMFAGKLADQLMETKMYGKLVQVESGDTYASVRAKLIFWIRANASEAAKLWRDASTDAVSGPGVDPSKLKQGKYTLSLSKRLLQLLKETKENTTGSHPDEDLAFAADRLFTGSRDFDATMYAGSSGGGGVYAGGGHRGGPSKLAALPPLDFKLNSAAAAKEDKRLSGWLSDLRARTALDKAIAAVRATGSSRNPADIAADPKLLEKYLSATVHGKSVAQLLARDFAERDKILGRADAHYRDFSTYMSRFLTRSSIQSAESAEVEKLRKALRADLAQLAILSRAFSNKLLAADMADMFSSSGEMQGYPKDFVLRYKNSARALAAQAQQLNARYAALYDGADASTLPQTYLGMQELEADSARLKTAALLMTGLPELDAASRRTGTPVFLERALLPSIMPLNPDAEFIASANALHVYKQAISAAMRLLAAGDFDGAINLMGAGTDGNALAGLAKLRSQTIYCVSVVAKERQLMGMLQSLLIEGPVYSAFAPVTRSWLENPYSMPLFGPVFRALR